MENKSRMLFSRLIPVILAFIIVAKAQSEKKDEKLFLYFCKPLCLCAFAPLHLSSYP
jgi:hypothetical protein